MFVSQRSRKRIYNGEGGAFYTKIFDLLKKLWGDAVFKNAVKSVGKAATSKAANVLTQKIGNMSIQDKAKTALTEFVGNSERTLNDILTGDGLKLII